jgi:hypothetical protein
MPGTSFAEVEEHVCNIQDINLQDLLMFFVFLGFVGGFFDKNSGGMVSIPKTKGMFNVGTDQKL